MNNEIITTQDEMSISFDNSSLNNSSIIVIGEETQQEDNDFYYSKTILSPTVITQSVCGNFRNTNATNLEKKVQEVLFVKENCFEILEYYQNTQSLESITHQSLFSIVKDIKVLSLPINSITTTTTTTTTITTTTTNTSVITTTTTDKDLKYFDSNFKEKDFIVVTSDSGYLSILSWSNLKKQFLPVQNYKISPQGYSFKYLGEKIQISKCNRLIGVCALRKKLSIFLVNPITPTTTTTITTDNNNQDEFTIISKQIEIQDNEIGDIFSFDFVYEKDDLYYLNGYLYIVVISKIKNGTISNCLKFKFNFENHKIEKITTTGTNQLINQKFNYEIITLPKLYKISSINYNNNFLLLCQNDCNLILTNSNFDKLNTIKIGNEQLNDDGDGDDGDNGNYNYLEYGGLITTWNWNRIENSLYLLLGNEKGSIYKVEFEIGENQFRVVDGDSKFSKRINYQWNPIQSILNLKDNHFAITSDLSDGGIFKIDFSANLQVEKMLETIENHCGIVDFDIQKQKLSTKIYACCSGGNSIGSVKVIENSIPTTVLGDNKITGGGTTNVWCFSPYIVIGLVETTLISKVDSSTTETTTTTTSEPENLNFITNQTTIYCYRTDNGTFVQVTPTTILLYNPMKQSSQSSICWYVDQGSVITNACSRDSLLLVSISKPNKLIAFNIGNDPSFEILNSITLEYETSCISIPHFNHDMLLDKQDSDIFNTCIIGNYQLDIVILNFKTSKQIFSLSSSNIDISTSDTATTTTTTIQQSSSLSVIPHSVLLSTLQEDDIQNLPIMLLDNQIISFKLLVGQRDGKLFKWDLQYNLQSNIVTTSNNCYQKTISNSPISITPVLNQGAIILTNLPYYITCVNNHLSMIKISYKDDQLVTGAATFNGKSNSVNHSKLEFIFTCPDFGFSLVVIDFSKRQSIRKLQFKNSETDTMINNRLQQKQNPNRLLFIDLLSILIVLGDSDIWLLNAYNNNNNTTNNNNNNNNNNNEYEYYKILFSTSDNIKSIKSNHSIKYWNIKNLIIVYGTNFKDQGLILFYSIQLNDSNGINEISLKLEKKRIITDSISSVLPISDGKYLVFTNSGNLLIDYNSGIQINLEDNQNAQILTPHPITVSKFNQSDNKLFLSTELNGLDIYNCVENTNANSNNVGGGIDQIIESSGTFNIVATEKSKFISDALFLQNDKIAIIDKYGNFKILNLNQHQDVDYTLLQDQHQQQLQQAQHQQQQQQQNNNNNNGQQQPVVPAVQPTQQQIMIDNFIPNILDEPLVQYSLKETCLKLYQFQSDNGNMKILTCSLLGSVILFGRLSKSDYQILSNIQNALKKQENTKPILNGDHQLYRSEISITKNCLDGDLLYQFLYLDESDQFKILNSLPTNNNNNNNNENYTTKPYSLLSKVINILEEFNSY